MLSTKEHLSDDTMIQCIHFSLAILSEQSSYGQPGKLPRNFCKTCGVLSTALLAVYVRHGGKIVSVQV